MAGRTLLSLALLALAAPSVAQQDPAEVAAPRRVHIVGASVSGGFKDGPLFGAKEPGDSVTLHRMLKRWCADEAKVTTHPPLEMWNLFRDPVGIGKKQIALARRRQADLLVAVDFPFWFAYGYVRGDAAKARAARLARGLELLDELRVPVVVGDLPDMRGAAVRMLKPRQIPKPEVLAQLNAQLKRWADEREHVTLVPLAGLVDELKVAGVELPLAGGPLRTAPAALLQEDRLHATRLGVALLTFRLQDALRSQFPDGHALRQQQWPFERFVEAAAAEVELESLQERARAKAGK
ncbi:MAG: hypothetical protein KAI24_18420 [Planctomycetes bacterium]|nr:hypothetical protein [Planctomycetota bacterium]